MKKCDSYHTQTKRKYEYHPITGEPTGYDVKVGVCWGTKETDQCSCGGDRTKCDFYPEVREKALKECQPNFGEWISVEDRLPENCQEVLVYRGQHSDLMNVYTYMGNDSWEDDYGYWSRTEDEGITHWMPLPSPPAEKEN